MADKESVLDHHTVDGIQPFGCFAAPIHQRSHRGFVGHGHRQAGQPERSQSVKGPGGVPSLHLEGHEGPVQAGGIEGCVEQSRRQGVPDRVADHRGKPSGATDRDSKVLVRLSHNPDPSRCRPAVPARIRDW